MNMIKKTKLNSGKKSIVIWVLKWLTIQSKNWDSLKGFDNKEYVIGECSFNVYEIDWKMHIEDKKGIYLPSISEYLFDNQSHAIRTLEKWIKYPCKYKWTSSFIDTKIFCNFVKFC